jgi:hypothetical protein
MLSYSEAHEDKNAFDQRALFKIYRRQMCARYPDWAERNEHMLEEIRSLMRNGFHEIDYLRKLDYVK